MEIKIHLGTPKGRESLCRHCSYAQHMRGSENQEVIICQYGGNFEVTFPVLSCSQFEDTRLPSLKAMREIAWQIQTRARGKWGFYSAEERVITIEPPRQQAPDEPDLLQIGGEHDRPTI